MTIMVIRVLAIYVPSIIARNCDLLIPTQDWVEVIKVPTAATVGTLPLCNINLCPIFIGWIKKIDK